MIKAWERQQDEYPETAEIIQKGIDKIGSYQEPVEEVPACVLSMSEVFIIITLSAVLNHLRWFEKHWPDRVQWAKDLFMREVRTLFHKVILLLNATSSVTIVPPSPVLPLDLHGTPTE
jgi:hypothetical protein